VDLETRAAIPFRIGWSGPQPPDFSPSTVEAITFCDRRPRALFVHPPPALVMKQKDLLFALNETTHALRFAESAAQRFVLDPDQLETGSLKAASVAYITNQLADAQTTLSAIEAEITKLLLRASLD
jgi:hypothetical protein